MVFSVTLNKMHNVDDEFSISNIEFFILICVDPIQFNSIPEIWPKTYVYPFDLQRTSCRFHLVSP